MLQCRRWLHPKEQKTFYLLIQAVYQDNGTRLTCQEVSKLYGELLASAKSSHEVKYMLLHKGRKAKQEDTGGLSFKHNSERIVLGEPVKIDR